MRNKFWLALCCVFLLVPRDGFAYTVQGPGATSCAEFAKMYQASPKIEEIFFTWAQGYMSAINMSVLAADRSPRELGGEPADQERAFRDYCANNPLKNYMDGVLEVYGKLPFYQRK